MERKNNEPVIILDRPRQQRRGLTLALDGRITIRALPCRILGLFPGCKISFVELYSQPYLINASQLEIGIRLYGRKGQLHGSSVSTVRNLLPRIIGKPEGVKEIDLVVDDCPAPIYIGDYYCEGLAVITRTDPTHCR